MRGSRAGRPGIRRASRRRIIAGGAEAAHARKGAGADHLEQAPARAARDHSTARRATRRGQAASVQRPTDQRMSRSVGRPTAAVIRRTCRLRPSASVSASHAVGMASRARIGGSRGHERRRLGDGADGDRARNAVAQAPHLARALRAARRCGVAFDLHPVGLGHLVPRVARCAPAARRSQSARRGLRCRRRAGPPDRRRARHEISQASAARRSPRTGRARRTAC